MALDEGLVNVIGRNLGELEKYAKMSTEDKLIELDKLKQSRERLQRRLKDTETMILVLEYMGDVAEKMVLDDEGSTRLLINIQEENGLDYANFPGEPLERAIFFDYARKLEVARFVYIGDERIILTEKGKNFEYDGRFD
jgi:hypothetical protein